MALNEQERAAREKDALSYITTRREWSNLSKWWLGVYNVLGLLLLLSSGLAVFTKLFGFPDVLATGLSCLVFILTISIAYFKPEDQGLRYRYAWTLLDDELNRFLSDKSYTLDHVIQARRQGETIIHQTPAAPHTPQDNFQSSGKA